jgi:5-methylcytosine-specific restriction endonuclease McrA
LPNKTISQIEKKIRKLNLQKKPKWHTDEEYLIKLLEQGLSVKEICKLTKRNKKFITKEKKRLGYVEITNWTEREKQLIKENIKLEIEEISKLLPNRNKWAIGNFIRKLHSPNKKWTDEEIELLKEKYPILMYSQLKKLFPNKTSSQIRSAAQRFNIKKNNEVIKINYGSLKYKRKSWRQKILDRDNFTCQECKLQDETGALLDCHHIIPQRILNNNDSRFFDINNGICLCKKCHKKTYNHELEFTEKFFIKIGVKHD